MLSKIKVILPQTKSEVEDLIEMYDFKNVYYFPNFRLSDFIPEISISEDVFKIVFFARIHKMKGLDVMFYIADKLQNNNLSNRIFIDFYGQINEDDNEYFIDNVAKFKNIEYKGVLKPNEIYETITNYDVLLFPTHYIDDEGFPGSILDGYMSGVPVIASNWNHSKEFVKDGYCGYICDINDWNQFYNKIIYLFKNKDKLLEMKNNAFLQSKNYSSENAYNSIYIFLK